MARQDVFVVNVMDQNGDSKLGTIEVYSDDVERWVHVGLEYEQSNEYVALPLTISEAKELIQAVRKAILQAERNEK